jgi:putative hemolysin
MGLLSALAIALLLAVLTLASYVDRLYSEMGKFLSGEFQENIDVWEAQVEQRLGMSRARAALSAAILVRLSLACLTLYFGALLFQGTSALDRPGIGDIAQAVLGVILVILLFNQLLPFVFFTRTRGEWIVRLRWVLRLLFFLVLPISLLLSFLLSIAALAEDTEGKSKQHEIPTDAAVEALIEAGEEEGIIEVGDRDLVRSAVEFGDKVVRDVMTPRPSLFAVPASTTLEDFIQQLKDHPYSRVPIYTESLDHIQGIAFSHDLLHITDDDAKTKTVASIARPAAFVPETKRVNELLREMQREKHHMRIVIDEYGGVAGLVTIEDLLEEIVGAIKDEHEQESDRDVPTREAGGAWLVPGSLGVAHLKELFGDAYGLEQQYQATTVAGLVSEIAGRIPLPGEVVVADSLRFEVVASTSRRIERLRVSPVESPSAIVHS